MLLAIKTTLVSELFDTGRIWTEPVTSVADNVSSDFSVSASELTEYSLFVTQVAREFSAISGDLLEAGGSLGAPLDYVRAAGSRLMQSRYTTGASITGWRLWLDRSLRSAMVGRFGTAYASGLDAIEAAQGMFDILSDQSVASTSGAAPAATIALPTALTLGSATVSVPSNIGSFGPVGFEVSGREIFTLSDLTRKREAGFAEHKVVNGKSRLQFLGIGLWEVTVRIKLSRNWTDPEQRIGRIETVHASGEHHPLIVGGRNFGRFVLTTYGESVKTFGRGGEIETAELDLTLREYSDEGARTTTVSRVRTPTAAPLRQPAAVRKMAVSSYGGR
jgi:hypothetical protein